MYGGNKGLCSVGVDAEKSHFDSERSVENMFWSRSDITFFISIRESEIYPRRCLVKVIVGNLVCPY